MASLSPTGSSVFLRCIPDKLLADGVGEGSLAQVIWSNSFFPGQVIWCLNFGCLGSQNKVGWCAVLGMSFIISIKPQKDVKIQKITQTPKWSPKILLGQLWDLILNSLTVLFRLWRKDMCLKISGTYKTNLLLFDLPWWWSFLLSLKSSKACVFNGDVAVRSLFWLAEC